MKDRAKDQARAQLESIVKMVKCLNHVQDCDGEDCELTDAEILEGINLYSQKGLTASEEDKRIYHDEDSARQAIQEDPLSVEVRSDWHTPWECDISSEYMILLCTGGPAARILGDLGKYQEPKTAKLEYQDWGTPWTQYSDISNEENEALLTYARQFYFGG